MENLHGTTVQHGKHASGNVAAQVTSANILLVEDSYGDSLLMLAALNGAHIAYTLDRLDNGDDVLPYLENPALEKLPDVIFLDMELPGTDGFEILGALAAAPPAIRAIPIVIMTIQSNFGYLQKKYDLSICGYLTKPVKTESVQTILATLPCFAAASPKAS